MVLNDRDRSMPGMGLGMATKAMMGMNPASTMPNYSMMNG
jgi:hypothetical protein